MSCGKLARPDERMTRRVGQETGRVYAESFKSEVHLNAIVQEAQEIVERALGGGS